MDTENRFADDDVLVDPVARFPAASRHPAKVCANLAHLSEIELAAWIDRQLAVAADLRTAGDHETADTLTEGAMVLAGVVGAPVDDEVAP